MTEGRGAGWGHPAYIWAEGQVGDLPYLERRAVTVRIARATLAM
jgi:hypothetical protein